MLFYGDNLDVLRDQRRIKDESVDLCYMDPPFNSKRNYNQIYRNIGEDRAQAQAFIDTVEVGRSRTFRASGNPRKRPRTVLKAARRISTRPTEGAG